MLLEDKDADVREAAAEGFGQWDPGAKAAIPALAKLLQDGHIEVRPCGRPCFGIDGRQRAAVVAVLTELLKDKDADNPGAASALGEMGGAAKTALPSPHGIP